MTEIVPSEDGMSIIVKTIAALQEDDEVIEYLAEYHDRVMTKPLLAAIRVNQATQIQEAREELLIAQEKGTISDLGDNIVLANKVVAKSLKGEIKRIEEGRADDLSKIARNAADVMAKSVDKKRLMEDKPTSISVKTTAEEHIRTLIRLGILEDTKQLPEAEVVDD